MYVCTTLLVKIKSAHSKYPKKELFPICSVQKNLIYSFLLLHYFFSFSSAEMTKIKHLPP